MLLARFVIKSMVLFGKAGRLLISFQVDRSSRIAPPVDLEMSNVIGAHEATLEKVFTTPVTGGTITFDGTT